MKSYCFRYLNESKLIFIILLLSGTSFLFGQDSGEIKYTFHMNFGNMVHMKPKTKATLKFKGEESLFIYKKGNTTRR